MRIAWNAPAKLNLNLYVTGRRDDGYHVLDSLMVFTKWGDTVTVEPAAETQLTMTGLQLPQELLSVERDSPNLVVKALNAMAEATGNDTKIAITVHKNIPSGAGLGGGSSNAAATMHALNELWGYPLSVDELCTLGLQFGAEMPVCIRGQSARVQGVGDVITPVDVPLMHVVIAWLDRSLLTADVFQKFQKDECAFDEVPDDFIYGHNSLTNTAISLCPEVETIIETLKNTTGCQSAGMTGSGSACFGIFENCKDAEMASLQFENVIITQTI